jgi:hypothetical protein
MPQMPTVGRIVIYQAYASPMPPKILPAIIVKVHDGTTVDLQVFQDNTSGTNYCTSVQYDEDNSQGSWHWPERI